MSERQTTMPKRRNRMCRAAVTVASLSVASAPAVVSAAFANLGHSSSSAPSRIPLLGRNRLTSRTASKLRSVSLEQVSDFYQNFPIQSAVLTCGVKASVADTIAQVKPQIEENNQKNKELDQSKHFFPKPSSLTTSKLQPARSSFDDNKISSDGIVIGTIDWEARRNLAYVLYGGIFVGLMSQVEYNCVFPFLFGTEKTVPITIAKVFFDNLLVAPTVWLPPAYFIKAWVYSSAEENPGDQNNNGGIRILKEGLDKYLVDVRENNLLWQYWAIWFPAQSVSFSVIPDHLRVAFMASISFFWFILFSSVSSQGDKDETTAAATATSDR